MAKRTVGVSAIIFSVITILLSIGAGILPCIAQSESSQQESLGKVAHDLQQQGQTQERARPNAKDLIAPEGVSQQGCCFESLLAR
jgi:hypothetical protein